MNKYQIPEIHKPGFELISNLKSDDLNQICNAIKSSNVGKEPEDLMKSVEGKVSHSSSDLLQIFKTIYSIIGLSIGIENRLPDLITDLVDSYMDEFKGKNIEATQKKLKNNLTSILNTKGEVTQTIKAYRLLSENEKVCIESRIISDVRLVFDNDLSTKTRGAVVVHQLKLVLRQDGDIKEVYFSLDSTALNELKETINRAIDKEKLILANTFTKELQFITPKI